MRTANYNNQMFKQLQEVMKKCDGLSQEIKNIKEEHKKEIFELEVKHAKEINKYKHIHRQQYPSILIYAIVLNVFLSLFR